MARLRPSFWWALRSSSPASACGPDMVSGRCSRLRESRRHMLEVLSRIGAVERFVAEGEVGDDVAFDRRLQQRPLEPGRVARMAALDPAVGIEAQPSHDLAAKAF